MHSLVGGIGLAVADVLHHRARKHHGLLRHNANALTQVVQIHLLNRHAI